MSFIEPFFAFFINPYPDSGDITNPFADPVWAFSLWIQVGWSYALFAFMARYAPFAVLGFLIAFGLSRRKRVFGRKMFVEAAYGSWIGFLVGLTYDAIIMIVVAVRMLIVRPHAQAAPPGDGNVPAAADTGEPGGGAAEGTDS